MGRLACVSGYRNPDFRTLPELPHVPFLGRYEKNALVCGPMPPPLSHRLVFGELVCFPNDKDVTVLLFIFYLLLPQLSTNLAKPAAFNTTAR